MDILKRIDKGYILVEKAKSKASEISNDRHLIELEKKLNLLKEKEAWMRSQIDVERNKLMEKENQLADLDKRLLNVVEEIYETEITDNEKLGILKLMEIDMKNQREEIQNLILEDFTKIDRYINDLNLFKHKYNIFEKRVSKIRIANYEKAIYLDEKIKSMEKKIRKLRKMAEPELLKMYDRKREVCKIVFSKIEHKSCSLCKIELSERILLKVYESKSVTECENCKRILFMEETLKYDDNSFQ